jgi:hypothetical protein
MGCDIHIFTEVKGHGGAWTLHGKEGDAYSGRFYALFGALSPGVRGLYNGSIEPRDMPSDASEGTRAYYDEGFHSASHLTREEVIQVANEQPDRDDVTMELFKIASKIPPGGRIVFFFDS